MDITRTSFDQCFHALKEELTQSGARLVIFDNAEKMYVIDGDTTYLNILTEGLLKLLVDVQNETPDAEVHITIATRKNMSASYGIIKPKEYATRLEEKLEVARVRDNARLCQYTIVFEDARTFRRLDFADIVCNTYLTRKAPKKFNDANRACIARIYDPRVIYPVFESAAIRYAKQLVAEDRLGDAMGQLCLAGQSAKCEQLRQSVLERMTIATDKEREVAFTQMGLLISRFENNRQFANGISFAKRYAEQFLLPMQQESPSNQVGYRLFDTDFYILTMYDHLGNTLRCEEYIARCRENLRYVSRSWEHMEYYFRYCIREMNVLMGRFDFWSVLQKSEKLIERLQTAKELFDLVAHDDEEEDIAPTGSELLGKAWGVRLEACINLLAIIRSWPKKRSPPLTTRWTSSPLRATAADSTNIAVC